MIKNPIDPKKQERLKKALRENLLKRKQQSRERKLHEESQKTEK